MLHNHSVYSELSRNGKCRLIGYSDKMYPPVKFNPSVSKNLVIVSVPALAEAFFTGVDTYLIDLFSNPSKKQLAEKRLDMLVLNLPIEDKEQN